MKNIGRLSLLTAALLMGLGTALAQEQTPPATPPATEETPAPVVSQEATLTIGEATITIPGLQDATLVKTFSTVLGGGVVYRGSVTGSIDQIVQAFTTAGFAAADGADAGAAAAEGTDAATGTTGDAAAGTTDTAAAGTATTGTAATGTDTAATGTTSTDTAATGTTDTATGTDAAATDTAATDTAAGTGTTATGLAGLPEGESRIFTQGGQTYELRVYERGGFTVIVWSRIGTAPASN
ncbi:hypothetical protein F8S09_17380 [Deinococcus sp. SDU3-2]|uniref:Uncharacterized protein n=1 Tax=Deinococcus terrestris TaxID=2651870 RepID=A0A7X1TT30_9DEIO|nr:hypothetical protein [Deinococcus terrestris]MPY68425.1 hypothetical protein [Deinococcus terrestris]